MLVLFSYHPAEWYRQTVRYGRFGGVLYVIFYICSASSPIQRSVGGVGQVDPEESDPKDQQRGASCSNPSAHPGFLFRQFDREIVDGFCDQSGLFHGDHMAATRDKPVPGVGEAIRSRFQVDIRSVPTLLAL